MANSKIILKKSSVAAKVPLTTDLAYGELAINYEDGKLYFKTAANAITSFNTSLYIGTTLVSVNRASASQSLTGVSIDGSAASWATARTITLSGDVSGSVSINGTANVTLSTSLGSTTGSGNIVRATSPTLVTPTITGDVGVTGAVTASGIVSGSELTSTNASGDEGGQINLAKAPNGTVAGGVTIDVYQNKIRFFVQGGDARGAYIDLSGCTASAGTNLISAGGGTSTTSDDNTNATRYLVFASGTGSSTYYVDSTTTPLSYNPSTSTLQASSAIFSTSVSHGGLILTSGSNVDQLKTVNSISVAVSSSSWTATSITGTAIDSGTYAITLSFTPTTGQEYYFSGVMSWFSGSITGTSSEEIVLHGAGYDLNKYRLYARINRSSSASTLELIASSNDGTTAAPSVKLQLRRIL